MYRSSNRLHSKTNSTDYELLSLVNQDRYTTAVCQVSGSYFNSTTLAHMSSQVLHSSSFLLLPNMVYTEYLRAHQILRESDRSCRLMDHPNHLQSLSHVDVIPSLSHIKYDTQLLTYLLTHQLKLQILLSAGK